jgi:hypothetical protein
VSGRICALDCDSFADIVRPLDPDRAAAVTQAIAGQSTSPHPMSRG